MKYAMTCTCGDVMSVDAENRDTAVAQMKGMMTADALAAHFAEKHPGETVPSVEQSNTMTEQNLQEVAA